RIGKSLHDLFKDGALIHVTYAEIKAHQVAPILREASIDEEDFGLVGKAPLPTRLVLLKPWIPSLLEEGVQFLFGGRRTRPLTNHFVFGIDALVVGAFLVGLLSAV